MAELGFLPHMAGVEQLTMPINMPMLNSQIFDVCCQNWSWAGNECDAKAGRSTVDAAAVSSGGQVLRRTVGQA
ncbi:hypothetical protein [Mycobacterium uberis]|uniref:hypothetical protein n=1 Tax=Mycobacterium uberis TaxID=2162698 RepID=UPI001FB3DE86|nr:hypothetical protein [Mycobacterium uberis]